MRCPNCGFENAYAMKFCGMCGASLMRVCPNCEGTSPYDYRFCGHCGVAFAGAFELSETVIPNGLIQNLPERDQPGSEPNRLGEPALRPSSSTLTGERRQATVLIADVRGSTQLLEQLGSETWVGVMNQVLQIMSAAIYRFGGEVDQFRGDGLIAFFGARSAHEDDPERAVLAALAMQQELKVKASQLAEDYQIEVLVRVGINTGEVITANIGNQTQHSEDTTMGGPVALAARLEASAEPGTILVGENTYRLIGARFKWKSLGAIPLRGLSLPVSVYRPLSPIFDMEQQQRLQSQGLWTAMVGRDLELQAIENSIERLREGSGGIVLISGEAGMGKSRLIFEARQRVEREEALLGDKADILTWLQGRCRSYGQTLPDSMWVDLWQRWLGLGQWVPQEEALGRLRKVAPVIWGGHDEEFLAYLATFLSLPLEEPYTSQVRQLGAEGLRRQYFTATYRWLETLAHQSPIAVVFTEVHWADETSLELLKFCLPLSVKAKVLFVVVYRQDRAAPVWKFKQFVETEYFHRLTLLELLPLDNDQSENLIQQMVGKGVFSEHIQAQILEKSNGNPYYLTELIQSLIQRGILKQDTDTGKWYTIEADIPLDLPDTLKSLLLARIDRLSPREKRILQMAAVIGPIFWFNVLEKLAQNGSDLVVPLIAMQRAQLITERGLVPDLGREYAFASGLIREAAYESILNSQREELHLLVADYLEQIVQQSVLKQYHGTVAYHFRQAGNFQKELFHIMLAAQEAQQIHANAEAIQAYERALTLIQGMEEWGNAQSTALLNEWKLEALRGLGQIQFGIGKIQEAEKHFREAIALSRQLALPASILTRLFYWLGEVLFWQNDDLGPIRLGEEGLALLGHQTESTETALMNQLVAIGSSHLGDHDKFLDFTLRTAGFIQRLPYSEELRPAFDHIIAMYGYTLKNIPEARRWLEIMRQKAQDHGDLRALGEYFEYSAVLLFQEGNLKDAIPLHRKAIEQFVQIGDTKHASRAWKSLGVSLLQQGDIQSALTSFDHALEAAAVFANEADYAIGYWYRGEVLLCQKNWESALASFQKASKIMEGVPYLRSEWGLSGVGRVYLAQGMKENARATYEAALKDNLAGLFQNPYQANEILSGLERSFEKAEDYRSYVEKFHQHHPELHRLAFKQWALVPKEINPPHQPLLHTEKFTNPLALGWEWIDDFGDCAYRLQKGITIHAPNERNLHHLNRSAPKLLWHDPVVGDFTLQTICQQAIKNKPTIGGLLVWLSEKYWFCFEIGGRGIGEVTLRGFMNNHDLVFGRGLLQAKRIYLRLERRSAWLSAYCSSDGSNWLYAGGCELTTVEALQLGIHAIGHINRLAYPDAYPDGTAIKFKEFWLWGN